MLHKLLIVSIAYSLIACGSDSVRNEDSDKENAIQSTPFSSKRTQCYGVINGVLTNDYPSVVLLARTQAGQVVSRCTGTYVGQGTVFTAAHCVGSGETGDLLLLQEDCSGAVDPEFIESTEVFHHGFTAADFQAEEKSAAEGEPMNYDLYKRDFAIVLFPASNVESTREVHSVAPSPGSEVEMVGFGIDVPADDPGAGKNVSLQDIKKRKGINLIDEQAMAVGKLSDSLAIRFDRETEAVAGDHSNIAKGDSGGPLFFEDKLVGVTSAEAVVSVNGESFDVGLFTDLQSDLSIELIEKALDGGATIEGYEPSP